LRKVDIQAPSFGKLKVDKKKQVGLLDLTATTSLFKILESCADRLFGNLQFFNFTDGQPSINEQVFEEQIINTYCTYAETPEQQELYKLLKSVRDSITGLHQFCHKRGQNLLYEAGDFSFNNYTLYDLVERTDDGSTNINKQFWHRMNERLK